MTCSRAYPLCSRMPRGLRTAARWALVSALALGPLSAVATPGPVRAEKPAASAAVDLPTLLSAFAGMPGLEARFVEEKRIALLAQPLESKGRLYFTKPGLLLRRVEAPSPSEVVITPDEVRLKEHGREQTIDLRTRRDLRPFIESLVWILAGNQKALADVYRLSFEPEREGAPWQLTLTPKGEPLSRLVQHIRIRGKGLAVSEVEVRETSGDESVTRIVEANPARTFDADERRRLFGPAGAKHGGS